MLVDCTPPRPACQVLSVATRVDVPSVYVIFSWARKPGVVPHLRPPCRRPAYQPSPSTAPIALSPCLTRLVTSYVWLGTRLVYSVQPGARTASPTFWPLIRASFTPRAET